MIIEDKIIDKIHAKNAISFHDFMEMALYFPEIGYYTSTGEKTGIKGDYYTSPALNNIFGTMIGKQVEEMWQLVNEPCFTIVEYGAGNGVLCHDILTYLQKNNELYNGLTYYIIEKSPFMIEIEKAYLKGFTDKIKWIGNIKEAGDITGCIFSNEVVDNFSVHQVIMQNELMEIFVDYKEKFIEVLRPASEKLKDYLRRFNIILPKNFRTEINLQAENWIKEIAATLKKGFVLTIDYGYPAAELYHPNKSSGTMLCYHHHTITDDPFLFIGKQDITTHINFSALLHTGATEALEYCGFTTQSFFLSALGLTNHLRQLERNNRSPSDTPLMISSITALMSMGQKFKVFIQQKGLKHIQLSGMRYPLQLE